MKRTLVAFAVALAASSLQAQPLAHEVIRDAAGRVTYLATEDGAVAFTYDMRAPFFSHMWTHNTGWIAMPGFGEPVETTLATLDARDDTPTTRQLKSLLRKPVHSGKCELTIDRELMTYEKADCTTGPPDITVDVVATAPTRAWSGTIGGISGMPVSTGGPVSTRGGYPFGTANERLDTIVRQRNCSAVCDRNYSTASVSCAFAAVIAKSPAAGLACTGLAWDVMQACKAEAAAC
jgi:hypothetical protein